MSGNTDIRIALIQARWDQLYKERTEHLDKVDEIDQSMSSLTDQLKELKEEKANG